MPRPRWSTTWATWLSISGASRTCPCVRACATAAGWLPEPEARMSAGILVVAAQRDLRRNVFDALDGAGHPTVHTARGVPHAELLLDGRPPLALVVVAFDGDAIEAQAACEQLRRIPACADAPMIAVLADGATVKPGELQIGRAHV